MSEENTTPADRTREQSTVQFPYSGLDEALTIARAIMDRGAVPLSREQLAVALEQREGSGAFVAKMSAARMFGLIEAAQTGKVKLTQLGHEALDADEGRSRAARAAAFLNVELYRKLYDEFRGRQLPPRPLGLEEALVGFGVAPKQKTNARYALDKSAKAAGFYEGGQDRLVEPLPLPYMQRTPAPPSEPATQQGADVKSPRTKLDPVIEALISKLPLKGPWAARDRETWLTMMNMAFDMAYGVVLDTGKRPRFAPDPDDEGAL